MNENQQAAYVMSQVACALIKSEGMKARNEMNAIRGEYPAYGEDDFNRLIEDHAIGENAVVGLFKN